MREHESSAYHPARLLSLLAAGLSICCSSSVTAPGFGTPIVLGLITGNAQTGAIGSVLPFPLTVQVVDASGRGIPGAAIQWTVASGGGRLLVPHLPTTTDSTGLASAFWQLGGGLGTQTVVAMYGSLPAVSFSARAVLPLTARLTVISGVYQIDTVTRTLPIPLVAQVLRGDGTPDVGATVNWITRSPGGRLSPTSARADTAGHVTTTWSLGTVAGAETSAAVAPGLPPALFIATAIPGPPARVTIAPAMLPLFGVVGDTAQVTAQGWDRYGNLITGAVPLRSDDTTIAVVSNGVIQVRHHGSTWITGGLGVLGDSVAVTVLGWSGVSVGGMHRCGLSLAGQAYCWGDNNLGAIGDGTRITRPRPVPIGPGLGLQLPRTDWHTCALTASGQGYCWGLDQDGEVGDGSPNYATDYRDTVPQAVVGGHVFASIRAGRSHTCAVTTSGDAYCWGANYSGQLGRDTVPGTCAEAGRCSNWPILVAGGLTFTQVSVGFWQHSCGVTTSGAAYCWGIAATGRLGNDSTTQTCGAYPPLPCSYVPLRVEGGLTFKSVSVGDYFTCGLTTAGDGYCWGYGTTGDLGNGATTNSTTPVKVAGGLSFADIEAGSSHACGLSTAGKVYCWGGSYGSTPVAVFANLTFGFLAAGDDGGTPWTCALTTGNDLYCWYSGAF